MNIGERRHGFYGLMLIGGVILSMIFVLNVPAPRPTRPVLPPRIVVQAPQFPQAASAVKLRPRQWDGIEWAERINEQMMGSQQRWKALQGPPVPRTPSIPWTLPG